MRFSFGLKMGLAICLLSVSMTSLAVFYFYNTTYDKIWNLMSGRVMDIARTGLFLLDYDKREKIASLDRISEQHRNKFTAEELAKIGPGDIADGFAKDVVHELQATDDFQDVVNVLRQIKYASRSATTPPIRVPQKYGTLQDLPQIRYVYILSAIPESPDYSVTKFIADGDYEELDMNENGKIDDDETTTDIGMLYNTSDQNGLIEAFHGKVAPNSTYTEDVWGVWVSAFAPIEDRSGKIIGVLGVDYRADGVFNEVRRLKYIAFGIILSSFILSVLISYLLARILGKPIHLLRAGAERVRDRDYETKIVVQSKDELGLLADTFNSMVTKVRDYAKNLEDKVAERTAELENTLSTVQALKKQQDADYFLTNLLTNPLFKNYNRSEILTTEFYIKQKKEFEFKNKTAELGGDMCVTGNLLFFGQRYTMFCNADAMGKSMQGAGGALVMGTVLNSIMSRSASHAKNLEIAPRDWLNDTYQELHNVFLTFDGTMHVSCVLGLVEDQTGKLEYFTAEHPSLILYRRGVATLLEEVSDLRKLGSHIPCSFQIETLQLEVGDILFAGSDGKDDINLTPDAETRDINSDETLFLRIIEEADGSLEKIPDLLLAKGAITDDLSLIRISFMGSPSHQIDPQTILGEIAKKIKAKQYEVALRDLRSLNAASSGALAYYYEGLCLEKLGQETEAIPLLEKALGMEEKQGNTFSMLGRIYYNQGMYQRAAEYWEQAAALKPENERLKHALSLAKRKTNNI